MYKTYRPKLREHNGTFGSLRRAQFLLITQKVLIAIIGIMLFTAIFLNSRNEVQSKNAVMTNLATAEVKAPEKEPALLTAEELKFIERQQELILIEAQTLKEKKNTEKELATLEKELAAIRKEKTMSFQDSLKSNESSVQSGTLNADQADTVKQEAQAEKKETTR